MIYFTWLEYGVYHTYFQGPVGRRAFLIRFNISRFPIFIFILI
nr:MAG TPA: hypothetical protein [Caudoviricetes sp.]